MSKELTFLDPDSRGYRPEMNLIGTKWKHTGNLYVYIVSGFVWNGEDDTWMIEHTRTDTHMKFVRTSINFFGYRSNGELRYARA